MRSAIALGTLLALAGCAQNGAVSQSESVQAESARTLTPAEKETEQKVRLKIAADGLEQLYKLHPDAREKVKNSVGYAVFDVTSIYVVMILGQKGSGVMIDNSTGKPTFMSCVRAGTGPGVGEQRFFQIFIFKSQEAMTQFAVAGKLGGDIGASFSGGTAASAVSFNPTIDIYEISESGFAVQASWGATAYVVDQRLQ